MQIRSPRPILEILEEIGGIDPSIREGLLTESQASGRRVGEMALENGYTSEEKILEALSIQTGIPKIALESVGDQLDQSLFRRYEKLFISWAVIPLTENRFVISDPSRIHDFEKQLIGEGVVERFGLANFLLLEKSSIFWKQNEIMGMGIIHPAQFSKEVMALVAQPSEMMEFIVNRAYRMNASDIHFEPQQKVVRVLFRLNGDLSTVAFIPRAVYETVTMALVTKSRVLNPQSNKSHDGHFTVSIDHRDVQIRASFIPTIHNAFSVVLRILGSQKATIRLSSLGYPEDEISQMKSILSNLSNGMVFVTGPTGSGKNTSLHAVISEMDLNTRKMIDIGDPIEYRRPFGIQVQVWNAENEKWDYVDALRSSLRHDPDIIMIGEIRDGESARVSVQAARTGHLILTTLHVTSVFEIFERLLDFGISYLDILSVTKVVMNQRLLKKLCSCARPRPIAPGDLVGDLGILIGRAGIDTVYDPYGCDRCNGGGFVGRYALAEILFMNRETRGFLADQKSSNSVVLKRAYESFHPEWMSLAEKALRDSSTGKTSFGEVLRNAGVL
jgi:type II secretory ATPase GspE/PulE/Tfp pilus assembly ATPase PilB-like protein